MIVQWTQLTLFCMDASPSAVRYTFQASLWETGHISMSYLEIPASPETVACSSRQPPIPFAGISDGNPATSGLKSYLYDRVLIPYSELLPSTYRGPVFSYSSQQRTDVRGSTYLFVPLATFRNLSSCGECLAEASARANNTVVFGWCAEASKCTDAVGREFASLPRACQSVDGLLRDPKRCSPPDSTSVCPLDPSTDCSRCLSTQAPCAYCSGPSGGWCGTDSMDTATRCHASGQSTVLRTFQQCPGFVPASSTAASMLNMPLSMSSSTASSSSSTGGADPAVWFAAAIVTIDASIGYAPPSATWFYKDFVDYVAAAAGLARNDIMLLGMSPPYFATADGPSLFGTQAWLGRLRLAFLDSTPMTSNRSTSPSGSTVGRATNFALLGSEALLMSASKPPKLVLASSNSVENTVISAFICGDGTKQAFAVLCGAVPTPSPSSPNWWTTPLGVGVLIVLVVGSLLLLACLAILARRRCTSKSEVVAVEPLPRGDPSIAAAILQLSATPPPRWAEGPPASPRSVLIVPRAATPSRSNKQLSPIQEDTKLDFKHAPPLDEQYISPPLPPRPEEDSAPPLRLSLSRAGERRESHPASRSIDSRFADGTSAFRLTGTRSPRGQSSMEVPSVSRTSTGSPSRRLSATRADASLAHGPDTERDRGSDVSVSASSLGITRTVSRHSAHVFGVPES